MSFKYHELVALRKKIIENEFSELNDRQREAVFSVKGPLLILAGAGSGKTTVLVNRIAHILRWGEAYESDKIYGDYTEDEIRLMKQAAENQIRLPDTLARRLSVSAPSAWKILAITFTNKAARELRERICNKVGEVGLDIWASTFHAACGRILRRWAHLLGYTDHFTIYDTDDQKRLIKDCMKQLKVDEKIITIKSALFEISKAKDELLTPDIYENKNSSDSRLALIAKIYALYQKKLLTADAMDFDDMIFNTVILLRDHADVLEQYENQFQYIMVDEYQDTNHMQYELVRLLSQKNRNLCVVGDDDQSIYKFRGATIENILNFDEDYEEAKIIKLEQNYRSTKNILSAANFVIKNNHYRRDKTLWTANELGELITHYTANDEREESSFIAETIINGAGKGNSYSDYAVLYRTNAQSFAIERALVRAAVPYKIIGGRRFYERREIRDMIAYLNIISNYHDNARLRRIINIPKRGIGDKTASQLEEIGDMLGQSMFEIMRQCEQFEVLARSTEKLKAFCKMIEELREIIDNGGKISSMYEELVLRTEYIPFITHESDSGEEAAENVHELKSSIMRYEEEYGEEATLQGFLEETALLTDIDTYNQNGEEERVVLMTLHSAKGLEFDHVFIPGMEENMFPSYMASMSENEMQEERRLAYVGITRAKKKLYLISSRSRTLFGRTNRNRPSRFISEMPAGLLDEQEKPKIIDPNYVVYEPQEIRRVDIASSREVTGRVVAAPVAPNSYTVGMRVKHRSFGEGLILSTRPMGKDIMLEIAFDTVGTKKLMAAFAKLEKL